MKNKILRNIQKVFCAVMMFVVIIISTVFILISPISKRVIRQNIFASILTGGDFYGSIASRSLLPGFYR